MLKQSKQAPAPIVPTPPGDALLWLGSLLTLLPQLVRATSNSTSFPGWDLDPLLYSLSAPAISPSGSLLIDALTLLGAAILLLRAHRQNTPLNLSLILLALIGAAAVVFHGWIETSRPNSLGQIRTGASWLSAIFSALALWHAAQDLRVRRIFVGTLLGLMSLLALYGILQVFFTHAQTLADFNADPNRFLAAHGWSSDSSMAKAFVRRLSQPEASAWFGLANVYASFAAAATAAGLVLLFRGTGILPVSSSPSSSPSKSPSPPPFAPLPTLLLALFTLLSATALYLAHSKGGYLAFAAALASAILLTFLAKRPPSPSLRRLAALLGLAAILGPIALILIRGLIGDHSGELSLLFRSFYAQASARIFLDNPIVGVGPDGFQSAFLLAKPPLCPEEVMSPHCIPLDWLADLGILGTAWLSILFRFAVNATTAPLLSSSPLPTAHSPLPRSDLRLLLLLPALATILAAFVESPFITIDVAALRICGLAAWCATSFAIAKLITGSLSSRIALAAAALAFLAHAQIDVTGSYIPSAPLWLMLIALAAAPYTLPPTSTLAGRCSPSLGLLALAILPPILLSSLLFYTNGARVLPWERRLAAAAALTRPVAESSERLSALAHPQPGSPTTDSLNRLAGDLAKSVGHPVAPVPGAIEAAITELRWSVVPQTVAALEFAHDALPDDWRPLREASHLHLQLGEGLLAATAPEAARQQYALAESILKLDSPAPHHPSEYHWLATILERRAFILPQPDSLTRAIEARLKVAALDPYNLDNALKLFRDYEKLNQPDQAHIWAARTLTLHNFTRLDRETRGLSPQDLADIQRATSPPPTP